MIPKYLYQYTDIEALKKILQSQKILFNRLDLLNDPFEGIVMLEKEHKIKGISKMIYCSCWTANPTESISMWGIYKNFRGVRIKVKSNLFSEKLSLKETDSGFVPVGNISTIPLKDKYSSSGKQIGIHNVYGPIKIEYVSSMDETYSNVVKGHTETNIKIPEGHKDIKIMELGNRKVDYWKYEDEWRFKISAYSDVIAQPEILANFCDISLAEDVILVPFKHPIIEIMTGPCMGETEYEDIKTFLQENNMHVELVKSNIRMQKM